MIKENAVKKWCPRLPSPLDTTGCDRHSLRVSDEGNEIVAENGNFALKLINVYCINIEYEVMK